MPSLPPRPSFHSAPSEPSIRRLGVRSSTNIDRPIRAQLVLALIGGLALLAIPLYLLRSPAPEPTKETDQAPVGFAPSVPAGAEQKKEDKGLSLAEPVRVKCSSSSATRGKTGRLCDKLPFFEKALALAIEESADCAPRTGEEGTLNYVLTIDFNLNTLHVFPGASGTWTGPQARRATQCVKRALAAPDWAKLPHNFRFYQIAILATYKPPPPTEVPLFE